MYDVYRHVNQTELLLTTPHGAPLPERAQKARWKLITKKKQVPKMIVDEIARSGFSITRPIARPA